MGTRRIRVVLVDNDPDEMYFMIKGFESSKLFEIIGQFSNGMELMDWLSTSAELPEIIITDLNMPKKSGRDIVEDIAKNPRYAGIKTIITSITSDKSYDFKDLRSAAYLCLPKPQSLLEYQSFAEALYAQINPDILR